MISSFQSPPAREDGAQGDGNGLSSSPSSLFTSGDVASLVREMFAAGDGGEGQAEEQKTEIILKMRKMMMPPSSEGDEGGGDGRNGEISGEEEALYEDLKCMVSSLQTSPIYSKIGDAFDEMRTAVRDYSIGEADGEAEDCRTKILNVASHLRDNIADAHNTGAEGASDGRASEAGSETFSPIGKLLGTAAGVMRSVLAMTCRQVPSIEMPVVSGLVDSPIGKIVYHLGTHRFPSESSGNRPSTFMRHR